MLGGIGAAAFQFAKSQQDERYRQLSLGQQSGELLSQQQAAARTNDYESMNEIMQRQYREAQNRTIPKELTFREELQQETDEWLRSENCVNESISMTKSEDVENLT